jgi:hypothetical protein
MAFALSSSASAVRPAAAHQRMSAASKVSVARVASRSAGAKGRGALVVVANEKQGKGGEEGGVKFDRSVFGIVASNANYITLGSAIQKARKRVLRVVPRQRGRRDRAAAAHPRACVQPRPRARRVRAAR